MFSVLGGEMKEIKFKQIFSLQTNPTLPSFSGAILIYETEFTKADLGYAFSSQTGALSNLPATFHFPKRAYRGVRETLSESAVIEQGVMHYSK